MSNALQSTVIKRSLFAFAPLVVFVACSSGGDGGGGTTSNPPNPNSGTISGQKNFPSGNTPHNVTVSSNGAHLYTANINDSTISQFSVNAGTLTQLAAAIPTGSGPNQVVIHPNGQVVFTADQGTNTVTRFTVGANGALAANGTAHTFPGGSETNGIGFTNNPPGAGNQFAYVVNYTGGNVQAFTSDAAGNLTAVGGPVATGNNPHNVNVDKAGRFVYISNHESNFVSGFKINGDGSLAPINNAAGSPVTNLQGNDPTDNNPHWSAFDTTGQFLYVIAGVPPAMSTLKSYSINADGTLTQIGTTGPLAQCAHGHNVTVAPNNSFIYVACEDSATVYSFQRGANGVATNGVATLVTAQNGAPGTAPSAVVDPTSSFLYVGVTDGVTVFNIQP
ncbi:MAG TPA: beta-propeller fold lactonase family protein [Nitrospira sp.]|nr:beta-propeller fold lactonase family protein [Nitrospira sp.]